ncbi:MAG: hypothetical protein ABJA98_12845, partial [Acidobacteriota bacterium]
GSVVHSTRYWYLIYFHCLSWIDSYYEALEFLYWEPQHLGRKTNPVAELNTLEKVKRRLRRMEVTLNHNIAQFFLLAPDSFRNDLFAELFAQPFTGRLEMFGRAAELELELVNSMQPDLAFVSEVDVVSLEMKVGSKSSVTQVLKYALLGLAVEMRVGMPRSHYLALLGPGRFDTLWQARFETLSDLSNAIAEADLAEFLRKQPVRFRSNQDRFNQIVQNMRVSFLNYDRLAAFLRRSSPSEREQSPGAEVYRKLLAGMLGELTIRNLTT